MMSRRKERDQKYDALVKEYRKLSKRADQRLVRLEKLSQDEGFSNVKSWAYRKAVKDIKYWGGESAQRFNTKPPNDMGLLKAKIRDIQEFLNSATSTKKGIVNVYEKRADTLNKKYGTRFSWEDLAGYFEKRSNEKLDAKYGSKTMLRAVAEIQNNEDEIISKIKGGQSVDLKIKNEKVKNVIDELIKEHGIGVVDLY